MKLIITVDTEADNQWAPVPPMTINNVFALPRFQALCEEYAMPTTYLATYEVVADDGAARLLKGWQDAGTAEVGAHLHPWMNPPRFSEEQGNAFPSELSDSSLREKFSTLTKLITERIGKPFSYRAGRWGFDARQATLLSEFGYLADSSITPGVSWSDKRGLHTGKGGPDFTNESVMPHLLTETVLEVPMTIVSTGLFGNLKWLRIYPHTTISDLRQVIRKAQKCGLPAIVFMIHSSELVVGQSPYVHNGAALERVYALLTQMLAFCRKQGIGGVTLKQFAKEHVPKKPI